MATAASRWLHGAMAQHSRQPCRAAPEIRNQIRFYQNAVIYMARRNAKILSPAFIAITTTCQ